MVVLWCSGVVVVWWCSGGVVVLWLHEPIENISSFQKSKY